MCRYFIIITFFLTTITRLLGVQALNDAVLDESQRILDNTQQTCYQHIPNIIEPQGIYELDCSLLIEFILKKIQPAALDNVPIMPQMNRLQSVGFYHAILNDHEHWKVVSGLLQAQPGDIIAWRNAEVSANRNTGHIVVLAESPVRLDENTVLARVIDASSSRHDDDTRPVGGHGVGQGTMRFEVDNNGSPTGVYWSNRKAEPKSKAIVIGRLLAP